MSEETLNELMALVNMDKKVLEALSKPDFLERITLGQALSRTVAKEGKGKAGDYFFGMESLNLGQEFHVLVGPWRPRAVRLVKESVELESFDPQSATFKDIQASPTDQAKQIVNMFGLDFLVYVLKLKRWATIYLHSTARKHAPEFETCIGKAARIFSWVPPSKRFTWWVSRAEQFDPVPLGYQIPTKDSYEEALRLFVGAKGTEAEAAPEPKSGRPR